MGTVTHSSQITLAGLVFSEDDGGAGVYDVKERIRELNEEMASEPLTLPDGLTQESTVKFVYCGKTVNWIWMPFGMVSGVGRGMSILNGVEIVEGKGSLGVNVGHPTVTSGDFVA